MRTLGKALTVTLVLVSAACASGSGGSSTTARRDLNVLTQAEISGTSASDLLDAVEKLRPRWLQVRAPKSINADTRVLVFLNRNYLGGPEQLRQFDTRNVAQLRYLDASTATATLHFPAGIHAQGAIVVELTGAVN